MSLLYAILESLRVEKFRQICETTKENIDNEQDTMEHLAKLMQNSHESLKELYECSHPDLDKLIEISIKMGIPGARLTGAG